MGGHPEHQPRQLPRPSSANKYSPLSVFTDQSLVPSLTDALLQKETLSDELAEVLEYLQYLWEERGYDDPSLAPVLRCVGSALTNDDDVIGSDKDGTAASCRIELSLPFLLEALRIQRREVEAAASRGGDGGAPADVDGALVDLAVSLNAVGECLLALSLPAEAAAYLDEASEIRPKERRESIILPAPAAAGEEDARTPSAIALIFATAAYNAGRARFELDRAEAAVSRFGEAADLAGQVVELDLALQVAASAKGTGESEEGGRDNVSDAEGCRQRFIQCGSILHNAAQYQVELSSDGDVDESGALECFRAALSARRSALGPDHPSVAETLYELSSCRYRRGNAPEALSGFRECLRIERSTYGDDHPKVAMTKGNIEAIRKEMRETDGTGEDRAQ